ncbi:hypothetical protein CQA53_10805 [Helicobacter didelphidarum]|uniref:Uncharacterized protein n=1 Tax=Helicobacter didelphidarum TaxID=2040648 RepID=A0A3D8I625_9HELI|nr:hypothetical protein [Helicobacter didelphidarum]RDU60603.1 hypothetical protein CQA53_10805 [Helicobacter didelphidarum]
MKTGDDGDSNQDSSDNIESQSNSHQTKSDETNKDATINANNTDDRNKDSNQDSPFTNKENINKQILDMYFSYGKECERIKNNSKCQDDLNLHIITKDYEDGEYVEINANINDNTISLKGRVKDNEVVIMNVFRVGMK